jgi:hypothetical protein
MGLSEENRSGENDVPENIRVEVSSFPSMPLTCPPKTDPDFKLELC